MGKTTHEVLESKEFKKIVKDRWTVAISLAVIEFVLYYGYILMIALNRDFMAQKVGAVTTLGIPVGMLVIVISWVLTFVYVMWANNMYDPEVAKMNGHLKHLKGGKSK